MPRALAKKLTERQRKFCERYMVSGNAIRAATEAGYTTSSARTASRDLLGQAPVEAELTRLRTLESERTNVTIDHVVKELAALAFSGANSTLTLRALELLGKHLGMFIERVDHTTNGQPIEHLIRVIRETKANADD